jgi:2,3-bisphosphoglycerate-independent phosphoglycerate mutase
MSLKPVKPVMLIILDGWGIREMDEGNAPKNAHTPNYNNWLKTRERAVIDASEEFVGLVPGQMGNSEVGHLNLGAGRVVYQDISRIDYEIGSGGLANHPALLAAFAELKQSGKKLHLLGLHSPGGVHSHERHLYALLDITQANDVNPVLHIVTDGRDTPPESGIVAVKKLEDHIIQTGHGRISTLSGRYYTMDRDKRWERTKRAYDAIVFRESDKHATSASAALEASYAAKVTDEFVEPVVIGNDDSLRFESGDIILCYNFRSDRMRQIVEAFTGVSPDGAGNRLIENINILTMTEYKEGYPVTVLFGKDPVPNGLSETLSKHGLKQYHTAETEKYPHVTFFFNGGREDPFPGEDRFVAPSPKVATYDLKPEMSAYELTDATLKRIASHDDDFILLNFANPDMVGHTGSLTAAIKACEVVDECAGKLVDAINNKGGVVIVTADHGNCERMVELSTGEPHTYHTTNPVGLFVIGAGYYLLRPRGKLADVAPTILHLLGVEKPEDMTGVSLVDTHRD